ncbi:hypothetical protein AB0K18_45300 [Nonomuraea sp. NPDC049421]|uniref:hypothetical protein n=1 Tax=Nonomuraea sp. NPDC049421 TaxID=3155275 RepID=UPI00341F4F56
MMPWQKDAVTLARTLEHVRQPPTIGYASRTYRLAQAAHPMTAFPRDAVAWALPTPLYVRIITETMSWRP